MRQKEQAQYQWKENGKWILAVYNVQEFEIPDDEIEKWPIDEEVILPLGKKSKTEIEVIHDTISLNRFTTSETVLYISMYREIG